MAAIPVALDAEIVVPVKTGPPPELAFGIPASRISSVEWATQRGQQSPTSPQRSGWRYAIWLSGMDRNSDRQPAASTRPDVGVLGQVAGRLSIIDVARDRCDRRGWLHTERLVAEHCAYPPVPALLPTIAAACPRMQAAQVRDVCGIHLPQLSRLGL